MADPRWPPSCRIYGDDGLLPLVAKSSLRFPGTRDIRFSERGTLPKCVTRAKRASVNAIRAIRCRRIAEGCPRERETTSGEREREGQRQPCFDADARQARAECASEQITLTWAAE